MEKSKATVIGLNFMGGLTRSTMIFRGIMFLLFGLLLLTNAWGVIRIAIQVFGVILIINGIGGFFTKQTSASTAMRWAYPVLTLLLGLFAFFMPGETQLTILMFVAVWFLLSGGIQLAMLFSPNNGSSRAMIGLSAAFNLLIGLLFLTHPFTGLAAFAWLLAIFMITGAIFTIVLGLAMPQVIVTMPAGNEDTAQD